MRKPIIFFILFVLAQVGILSAASEARLGTLKINNVGLENFNSDSISYLNYLPYTTTSIPVITGTGIDLLATVTVTPPTNLTGTKQQRSAQIKVVSQDGTTTKNYTVQFVVLPKLDIYIALGQSNMSGRGYMVASDSLPIDSVFLLTPGANMEIARNPLNKYSSIEYMSTANRIGPAYSFCKMMRSKTGHNIGLMQNSKGGTAITQWVKGAVDGFYAEAVRRSLQAKAFGDIKGMIWHQGEASCSDPNYTTELTKMVSDFRTDLGLPNLFFIAGELAKWLSYTSSFNATIQTISSFIPNSDWVSSAGLTPLIDTTDPHFCAASQIILGERYAAKMLNPGFTGIQWVGPASGGDWSDGANWSTNVVPGATDSVLIASPNTVTISTAVSAINKLIVQGSLNISSSGSLTISQGTNSIDILEIGGGTVTNAGSLALTRTVASTYPGLSFVNSLATTNGTLTNTGTLTISTAFTGSTGACVNFNQTTGGIATLNMGNSGVTLIPASAKTVFNVTAGTAQIGGTLTFGSSSTPMNCKFINVSAGSLTLLPSANINAYVTFSSSNNSLSAAAGTTTTLTNNGTLAIHLGTSGAGSCVFLLSPSTASATTILSNAGTITIDGANSTGSVGTFGFQGSDATTIARLDNSGTITDTHTGTTASIYSFSATTAARIHTVNNSGTMSFSKGLTLGCAATINNNSGGIVNMSSSITGSSYAAPGTIVNNNVGGIFNFDVATLTTTVTNTLSFKNYGKIIGRGTFLTGTYVPESGGIIAPGNTNNTTGTAGTNAGTMVPTGQFTINGTPLDFSNNTFVVKVNGTTAGTTYDQVLNSTASAVLNLAGAKFNMSVGGTYTPATGDVVKPFSASGTISGTLGTSSVPLNWSLTTGASAISATYSVSTAVENLKSSSFVSIVDGKIQFTTKGNQEIEIYNAIGQKLLCKTSVEGLNSIGVSAHGLVIVKVGNYSQKIVL